MLPFLPRTKTRVSNVFNTLVLFATFFFCVCLIWCVVVVAVGVVVVFIVFPAFVFSSSFSMRPAVLCVQVNLKVLFKAKFADQSGVPTTRIHDTCLHNHCIINS